MSENSRRKLEAGTPVIVVLHDPREKYWGLLDEITQAGVFLRGLELNGFDDWTRAVAHDEPFVGIGEVFFPLWRVERISRDAAEGGIPSLCEQAEQRTGRKITELLTDDSG